MENMKKYGALEAPSNILDTYFVENLNFQRQIKYSRIFKTSHLSKFSPKSVLQGVLSDDWTKEPPQYNIDYRRKFQTSYSA